jgi:hypothetical protein
VNVSNPRLIALVTLVGLASTGCMVHLPLASSRSAASSQKCPPGHQWSDGSCHDRGKGHDPAKHSK